MNNGLVSTKLYIATKGLWQQCWTSAAYLSIALFQIIDPPTMTSLLHPAAILVQILLSFLFVSLLYYNIRMIFNMVWSYWRLKETYLLWVIFRTFLCFLFLKIVCTNPEYYNFDQSISEIIVFSYVLLLWSVSYTVYNI